MSDQDTKGNGDSGGKPVKLTDKGSGSKPAATKKKAKGKKKTTVPPSRQGKKTVTLFLTDEEHAALTEAAKQDCRSAAGQALFVIRSFLASREEG